jgi:hypothetical protein
MNAKATIACGALSNRGAAVTYDDVGGRRSLLRIVFGMMRLATIL